METKKVKQISRKIRLAEGKKAAEKLRPIVPAPRRIVNKWLDEEDIDDLKFDLDENVIKTFLGEK